MPQIDVKITDLDQIPALRNDDLFLVANPMADVEGNPIANYPYTSNSISGGALSTTIRHTMTNENTIICSEWHYDIKINIDHPFSTDMTNNLCTANDIEKEYGYVPENESLVSSSSRIPGSTIVNKDYVDQLTKILYQNIISNLISGFTTIYGNNNILQSKPGSIIHSTKFEPLSLYTENGITVRESSSGRKDAKMRYYFGDGRTIANFGGFELKSPNTKWILHSGYFLRGANSSQPNSNDKNSASFNGGGQDSKDYSVKLKNHSHILGSDAIGSVSVGASSANAPLKSVSYDGDSAEVNSSESGWAVTSVTGHKFKGGEGIGSGSVSWNRDAKTDISGDGDDPKINVNHLPKYKNVYIWERIN